MDKLYVMDTNAIEDGAWTLLCDRGEHLPYEIREKIKHTRRFDLKKNRLSAWLLLASIVRDRGDKFAVSKGKNGKPYISGSLHFNYSHSGHWLALGLSEENIGIDIETKKCPFEPWLEEKIRRTGFSWRSGLDRNAADYISSLWSAYESHIKYKGERMWSLCSDTIPITQMRKRNYILSYCGNRSLRIERLQIRRKNHDLYACGSEEHSIFRL